MSTKQRALGPSIIYVALTAAVCVLLNAASAGATVQYLNDGAIQNEYGGWDLPPQGTCPADVTKATRPDCLALRLNPVAIGTCATNADCGNGVCRGITQAQCTAPGVWNPATSTCSGIAAATCTAAGGTVNIETCVVTCNGVTLAQCAAFVPAGTWNASNNTCYGLFTAATCTGAGGTTTGGVCQCGGTNDCSPAGSASAGNYGCTSGVCNDLTRTTKTTCEAAGDRLWNSTTNTCAVVMKGDDRNNLVCALHGGTWISAPSACTGNWVMPARTAYNPPLLTGNGPGDQCLRCHNSETQYNGPRVRDTDETLTMGHRNMSRKVTAGKPWGGPPFVCTAMSGGKYGGYQDEEACEDAGGEWVPLQPYPSDDGGQIFDWTNAKVGAYDALWIYGDWLAPLPRAIYKAPASTSKVCSDPRGGTATLCQGLTQASCEALAGGMWNAANSTCSGMTSAACTGAGGTTTTDCQLTYAGTLINNAGAAYSCARCHTTGWTSDAARNTATGIEAKEPETSFPLISWDRTGNAPANVVNLAGGVLGDANVFASWDNFGIVCTRCHNSAIDTTTGSTATPPQYSAPAGMSSHHNNLTAPDNSSGVCTDTRYTLENQCTPAGGTWLTACSITTPNICTLNAGVSAATCTGTNTWTATPSCNNALYTNQTDCLANGGAWTAGWCKTTTTPTFVATPPAAPVWTCPSGQTVRVNGSQASCQVGAGTWTFPVCSLEGTCTKGTCSNGAYTDEVSCTDNGNTWTPIDTKAACTTAGGQFAYATDIVRCLDAGGAWAGTNNNRGQIITRVCMDCHRQETTGVPYANGLDVYGKASYVAGGDYSLANPGMYLKVGPAHGTVAPVSHPHGSMFLNSPHGRFIGNFNQVATAKLGSGYDSEFLNLGEAVNTGNGCTGCHDVHQSTVPGVGGEPIHEECTECHTVGGSAPAKNLNLLRHPLTPFKGMNTTPSAACETCHMPEGLHLFRINADVNYSTYPMTCSNNSDCALTNTVNANVQDDDGFARAVWVDLDLACGQCHGGGTNFAVTTGTIAAASKSLTVADATGFARAQRVRVAGAGALDEEGDVTNREDFESYIVSVSGNTLNLAGSVTAAVTNATVEQNPTANGAPYFSKANLAALADGIHGDTPFATFAYTYVPANPLNRLNLQFNASGSSCKNANGQVVACTTYEWEFDTGAGFVTGTAVQTNLYATGGTKNVTLRVTGPTGATATATRSVKAFAANPDPRPVVGGNDVLACSNILADGDPNTWSGEITDSSTDNNTLKQVTVNWGDGTMLANDTAAPFGPFTHTYKASPTASCAGADGKKILSATTSAACALASGTWGRFYYVVHTAVDSVGQMASKNCPVEVLPFTISGTVSLNNGVTTAPLSGATVFLKKGLSILKTATSAPTTGAFTFTGIKPGSDYTLTASMTGVVFPASVAVPTVGPDQPGLSVIGTPAP